MTNMFLQTLSRQKHTLYKIIPNSFVLFLLGNKITVSVADVAQYYGYVFPEAVK